MLRPLGLAPGRPCTEIADRESQIVGLASREHKLVAGTIAAWRDLQPR